MQKRLAHARHAWESRGNTIYLLIIFEIGIMREIPSNNSLIYAYSYRFLNCLIKTVNKERTWK
jgi:hypothetical protein